MTKSSYGAKDRAFDAERAKFRRERNDLRKQIERERRAQDDLRADIDELRSRLASQDEWIERLLELTELTPAEAKNLVEDRRRQADAAESLDAVLGRNGLLGGLMSRMAPGIASTLSMFAAGAGETLQGGRCRTMSERGLRTLRVDVVFLDLSRDMVELTVPEKTTDAEITSTLSRYNDRCFDEGLYEDAWNTETLMNAVCRGTGWTWRPVTPDVTWVDSTPAD